jgi:RNA polymerase sigma-70 factor (ECF subfamily)
MTAVADAFFRWREGARQPRDTPEVRHVVEEVAARARAAWPGVAASDEGFGRALAAKTGSEDDLTAALQRVPAADLYLAVACAEGDLPALRAFEQHVVAGVRSALERQGFTSPVVDDALQTLRSNLLLGTAGEPEIAGYGARGSLRGWVRVVALRIAYRIARSGAEHTPVADIGDRVAESDLEMELLKGRYGEVFRRSFRHCIATLSLDDRLLLKQRYALDMTVAELAALHGVHASTISRRAAELRARLVDETRAHMMAGLNIGAAEVSSVLRLIQSQLDFTLSTSLEVEP